MAKEMAKEFENKSREFFEFVLPPVEMRIDDSKVILTIDLPGFKKDEISIRLKGRILSINAEKKNEPEHKKIICDQRPRVIDKKIRLPVHVKEDEKVASAKFTQGVLTVTIPFTKRGQDIPIE